MHATGAGAAQLPAPSHLLAGPIIAAPVQLIVTLQSVVALASAQAPAPLHCPVLPQGGAGGHAFATRGAIPAAMLEQVPTLPVSLQLWHEPAHAPSQHTPSVQLLLMQSPLAAHTCPFGKGVPQIWSTWRQITPAAHSVLEVQMMRQALAPQT